MHFGIYRNVFFSTFDISKKGNNMMNYNTLARVKKFVFENLAEHELGDYYSEVTTELVCEEIYPYEKNAYKISLLAVERIIAAC